MLKHYLKLAWKVLLRRRFFTFISLFGISFTLVVLMVVTTLLDHVFGPIPPEIHQERTLGVYFLRMGGERFGYSGTPGYGFLDRYTRRMPGVETESFSSWMFSAHSYLNGRRITSWMKRTDAEFWQLLRFQFLEGGPFSKEDERAGRRVAVINEATREKFFGSEPAVGKTLEVDGQQFQVAGVVANVPYYRVVSFADIWVPSTTAKTDSYRSEMIGSYIGLLLAESREALPLIRQEFQSRLQTVEFPDPRQFNQISGGAETLFEFVSRMLFSDRQQTSHPNRLLGAILLAFALFMLLPAINLMNINVSRILERTSEIGVRKAFGASSWTLVGQFVVENIVLCLVGGALGFVLSLLALRGIEVTGWLAYADFQLNQRVFLYALLLSVFFGLLSGVYPAWRMSRLHPVESLKGGIR